jgi:Fungal hydrophobin
MFSKVALFITAFLTFLLLASAGPIPGGAPVGSPSMTQCNNGPVQCCQSVQSSDSNTGAALLGLVNAPAQNVITAVGFNCNPITYGGQIGGAAGTAAKW